MHASLGREAAGFESAGRPCCINAPHCSLDLHAAFVLPFGGSCRDSSRNEPNTRSSAGGSHLGRSGAGSHAANVDRAPARGGGQGARPHLKLKNDLILAEYFKKRIQERTEVVIAPAVTYHFYPAFLEYPGSTSLRLETARDLVVDICRSLARFGPRRFYVINTGIPTMRALKPAADALAGEGILLRYLDPRVDEQTVKPLLKQEGGRHADENETSKMLYMDPTQVDMRKAVKDYRPLPEGSARVMFTRDPQVAARGEGIYSPTGSWGDPTLATREKGKIATEDTVAEILKQIETLRQAAPPNTGAAK